ncbi:hypothetical protein EOM82_07155 [bacterium]|nr:hypothetical protein [bacterium]
MFDLNQIAERAKELVSDIPKIKIGMAERLSPGVVKINYVSYDKVDLSRIKYCLEEEFLPLRIYFTCVPISMEEKTAIFCR